MQPYQQRVVEEKEKLDDLRLKLTTFMTTSRWVTLPKAERDRLHRQHMIMMLYSQVLEERIAAFPVDS